MKQEIKDTELKSDILDKFGIDRWAKNINRNSSYDITNKVEIDYNKKLFIKNIYIDNKVFYNNKKALNDTYNEFTDYFIKDIKDKPLTINRNQNKELMLCESCHSIDILKDYWNVCPDCRLYEDLTEQFEQLENEDMNHKNHILEYEYLEVQRKTEPNHNDIFRKTNKYYISKCGYKALIDLNCLESETNKHKNCKVCKIINGSKRLTGLTQDNISKIFALDKNIKLPFDRSRYESSSSSISISSDHKTLYHYRNIQAIRTDYNKIIKNTDCWGSGYAYCPYCYTDHNLPLSTLGNAGLNIYKIKPIIPKDNNEYWGENIFQIGKKYYIISKKWRDNYLFELMEKPTSIKDAIDNTIPLECRNNPKVLRQKNLFFIPTNKQFNAKINNYDINPKYMDYWKQEVFNARLNKNNILIDHFSYPKYVKVTYALSSCLYMQIKNEILETIPLSKTLKRFKVLDSNSYASVIVEHKGECYVNGTVIYKRQYDEYKEKKLTLNKWYKVVKLRVKREIDI